MFKKEGYENLQVPLPAVIQVSLVTNSIVLKAISYSTHYVGELLKSILINERVLTLLGMQEYVDHGSCVYKFYIIGDKVMHSCRRSMPNAASMAVSDGSSGGLSALVFDRCHSTQACWAQY